MNTLNFSKWSTALVPLCLCAFVPLCKASTFNIEIDYMEGGTPFHSHKPSSDEIAAVVQMFACQGHTLNVVISDAIPHYDTMGADPSNCNNFFGYSGADNSFGKMRSLYFNHAGQPGWHYCIFGHNYAATAASGCACPPCACLPGCSCCVSTGSSGLAETPGGNLVVTLGSFTNQIGTPFDRASTLAHEFGHNLGLTHCGNMNCAGGGGVGNFIPIVPSTMTYFYQLQGVRTNLLCQGLSTAAGALFKEIDYSHGTMCSLNESALDESFGTGMVGVDWNCNGSVSGTVAQVIRNNAQGWCGTGGTQYLLSDYDEWGSIHDVTLTTSADHIKDAPTTSCITADEVAEMQVRANCAQPSLTTEACIGGHMIYMSPGGSGFATGTCSAPFNNVQAAHNNATNGSVLFFRAGTYNAPGQINLTKPLTLISTGPALIAP
ncbi:MAG TPA: hypothetical protein VMV81_01055 [Phycisphaerae bacterium]|nr:hypothetical protein [Phycisphaerae bacterium]